MNGIIEDSTGDLIARGYADFTSQIQAGETIRNDVPSDSCCRGEGYPVQESEMSRWNGTIWIKVDQP